MEPITPFPRLVGNPEPALQHLGLALQLQVPPELLETVLMELRELRMQQVATNDLLSRLLNKPAMKRVLVRDEDGRASHTIEEPIDG